MLVQHTLRLEEAHVFQPSKKRVVLLPPKVDASHDVFVQAMLEKESMHQTRNPMEWVASIAFHVAVLSFLLILPLTLRAGWICRGLISHCW
jgi:hypothetical protein